MKTNKSLLLTLILGSLFNLRVSLLLGAPTGAAFLKVNPSPRSYALAGSNVASSFGAEGAYTNPSNLSLTNRRYEAFSSFSSMLDGAQYNHLSLSINRNTNKEHLVDGLGFSYTRMGVGDLEGRDRSGQKTGSFTSQNSAFALSGSIKASQQLRLGATGKILQSEIAGFKSNRSLAMDLGMSYNLKMFGRNASLGGTISNLGQKSGFINERDPLPAQMSAGLGMNFGMVNAMGSVSRGLYDEKTVMSLGAETSLGPVSLRAGFRSDSGAGNSGSSIGGTGVAGMLSKFSTGLGFHLGAMRLDYAVGQEAAELGLSHRAALSFQFGKKMQ